MSTPPSRYADWKAPDQDGQMLLWPDAPVLLRQTTENRRALSNSKILIQNVPLGELRRRQRASIGHENDDQPLIATGHQTELYHPGVWVKDALTSAVARKVGGIAWHFAVDTDSPKHLYLRWPGGSMAITDDPDLNTAAWTGLLPGASPAHLAMLAGALEKAAAGWDFHPVAGEFLKALKGAAIENRPLAEGITHAIGQLDSHLGLRARPLLISPIWMSEPYLIFAHHLLGRAGEFASQYNGALAEYRRQQGVTSPGRPMPDLETKDAQVETPFWLDDLDGQSRQRLVLKKEQGGWCLAKGDQIFVFVEQATGDAAARRLLDFLQANRLRIAPRALTLTMFFRLLLADQYVHGIGGGRYDQVTDRIIASHFGIEPPRFSVTTATLFFPAARGQKHVSLRPLLQEGRRIRHGSFWREKRDLADRIATLPRRSRERQELFYQMHASLGRQASSEVLREWAERLDHATKEQMRQKTLFDRELFYAIQPEDRLREMISRYDAAIGAG